MKLENLGLLDNVTKYFESMRIAKCNPPGLDINDAITFGSLSVWKLSVFDYFGEIENLSSVLF